MNDVPMPHRREFTRVAVSPAVELTVNGAAVTDARVGNLSLRGVMVLSAERPAGESPCTVLLRLAGTGEPPLELGGVHATA